LDIGPKSYKKPSFWPDFYGQLICCLGSTFDINGSSAARFPALLERIGGARHLTHIAAINALTSWFWGRVFFGRRFQEPHRFSRADKDGRDAECRLNFGQFAAVHHVHCRIAAQTGGFHPSITPKIAFWYQTGGNQPFSAPVLPLPKSSTAVCEYPILFLSKAKKISWLRLSSIFEDVFRLEDGV